MPLSESDAALARNTRGIPFMRALLDQPDGTLVWHVQSGGTVQLMERAAGAWSALSDPLRKADVMRAQMAAIPESSIPSFPID